MKKHEIVMANLLTPNIYGEKMKKKRNAAKSCTEKMKVASIFLAIFLFSFAFNGEAKAQPLLHNNSATDYIDFAQDFPNPYERILAQPWPDYRYAIEPTDNPCCVKFTYYCAYWANYAGEEFKFYVEGGTLESGGRGIIRDTAVSNGISAIICVETQKDIVVTVAQLFPLGYETIWGTYTIPARFFAECEEENEDDDDECYKGDSCSKWQTDSMELFLPRFPGCPIIYEFETRMCDGEYQVRGAKFKMRWLIGDYRCMALSAYLFQGGFEITIEDGQLKILFKRAAEILDLCFDEYSKQIFLQMYNGTPIQGRQMYYCDNLNLPPAGVHMTSYIRGACVSYCASYYRTEQGHNEFQFAEDDCSDGFTCCKKTVWYCMDTTTNNPVQNVSMEQDVSFCMPGALPNKQSCYTGPNLIWNYRSECQPSCE